MSGMEAVFGISIEGNAAASAAETAQSIEGLRARLISGEASVGKMSEALRRLKGSSAEVKTEKAQLRAKIDAEQSALGKLTAGALAAGVPVEQLSTRTKAAGEAAGGLAGAASRLGGPVGEAAGRLSQLGEIMKKGVTAADAMKFAALGLVAVVIAVAGAALGAVVSLSRFVVEGANAARSANLLREAATGSAQNAKNLGQQVDALAGKVSTSKEALNELAVGLARNGLQGQALVDTFNAVGQASAAMGDEAGNKIRGLIEAGRLSQRLFLSRESLVGTGVSLEDVAKTLAGQMKVGVNEAKAALAEGRVGLGVGAAAIRDTVEKKFGEINARKMLDINVQAAKFKEKLGSLTAGVKLEPFLKALEKLTGLFDEGTVTGATLKQLVTLFGDGLSTLFAKVAPLGVQFFKGLVIGGLTLAVSVLKLRKAFRDTFGESALFKNVDALGLALKVGTTAAIAFGIAVGIAAVAVGAMVASAAATVTIVQSIVRVFADAKATWEQIGGDLVQGFVRGIQAGGAAAVAAVTGLASKASGAMKKALGIRSPSTVFAGHGANTVEGYVGAVEDGAPKAQQAVDKLAPGAPAGGGAVSSGGAGSGGGAAVVINLALHLGGGDASGAKALQDPGFVAALTKALQEAARAAGLAPAVAR